jgi:hypothetical protein
MDVEAGFRGIAFAPYAVVFEARTLDPRFRGDDGKREKPRPWIPAFAGMTSALSSFVVDAKDGERPNRARTRRAANRMRAVFLRDRMSRRKIPWTLMGRVSCVSGTAPFFGYFLCGGKESNPPTAEALKGWQANVPARGGAVGNRAYRLTVTARRAPSSAFGTFSRAAGEGKHQPPLKA